MIPFSIRICRLAVARQCSNSKPRFPEAGNYDLLHASSESRLIHITARRWELRQSWVIGSTFDQIGQFFTVEVSALPSSFRDPSGFLFSHEGKVYRQVNSVYQTHYEKLFDSGLYKSLVTCGSLIPHEEVSHPQPSPDREVFKVLLPEQILYISYPYEWCFSQLKDAAILTLKIQLEALRHGMTLKDATAFNIQFHHGKPILIDTLSFETYVEGQPWIAYRQFCQHFLAPLALIANSDFRLLHLLRIYIDGIPLDLASRLLPVKSWFNYSILAHIHLHAKSQKQFEDSGKDSQPKSSVSISKVRLEGLVSSLLAAVRGLKGEHSDTEWGDYYSDTNYVDVSMQHKEQIVSEMLNRNELPEGAMAADFGANTGRFSRLAVAAGYYVLSHDIDEVAVDKNYRQMVAEGETHLLPLLLDLTNPSPGLGWLNIERSSFIDRRRVEVGMALALIHHIAISNNVPLADIASLFARLCRYLIIEFVPKNDSQVKRLLATREDIFPHYDEGGFESAFTRFFDIVEKVSIKGTERTLYFMCSKDLD